MFVPELLNGLEVNVTVFVEYAINGRFISFAELDIILAEIGVLVF